MMLNSDDEELNALKLLARSEVAAVRTAEIGSVVSYDHETQTATVQPIMQEVNNRGEYSQQSAAKGIPVCFPDFGDFVICADIPVGTVGTIYYMERDLTSWLESGNTDIKPKDPRRFDINDAFFVPALRPAETRLGEDVARAGELTIGKADGSVQIRIKGGEVTITSPSIKLGSDAAADALALASKVEAELTDIASTLTPIVTAFGLSFSSGTPVIAAATTPVYSKGSVGASKVKGE